MEQERETKEWIRAEGVVPRGAKIREIPWKQLIIKMKERIERAERLLEANRKAKDVRLQKKLGMMRLALLHQLEAKKTQEVDIAFLLETIELVNRMEEMLGRYEADIVEWYEFLNAIEKKLEEEGMIYEDEELAKQSARLKSAIESLRSKLEKKGPFKPMD